MEQFHLHWTVSTFCSILLFCTLFGINWRALSQTTSLILRRLLSRRVTHSSPFQRKGRRVRDTSGPGPSENQATKQRTEILWCILLVWLNFSPRCRYSEGLPFLVITASLCKRRPKNRTGCSCYPNNQLSSKRMLQTTSTVWSPVGTLRIHLFSSCVIQYVTQLGIP